MSKPRPSHFVNALQAAAAKAKPRAPAPKEPATQPDAPAGMRTSVSKAIAGYSYDAAAKRLRIQFRGAGGEVDR